MAIDQRGDLAPRRPGGGFGTRMLQWAALALSCVQGGCVIVEEPTRAAAQPRDDGVYRTGSRLPSRDSTGASSIGAISKEEWEMINIRREGASPPMGTSGR